MLIKSIEMKNFRQYRDTKMSFSCDETRNVTIVKGDNGAGKTTLAQAFLWCLYGETDFRDKEVLNRKVRELMNKDATKVVSVKLEVKYNGKDYLISRTQKYDKKFTAVHAESSNLAIYMIENGNTKHVDNVEKGYLIKKMLPKELSRFFFFDGEQIRVMSEDIDKGKSKDFKEAVQGLVGLIGMQNALRHMKPSSSLNTVIGYYEKQIDSKGDKKLSENSNKIHEKEDKKELLTKQIDEIELELKVKEAKKESLWQKIQASNSSIEIKEKYKKAKKKYDNLNEQRPRCINEKVLDAFRTNLYDFMTKSLIDFTIDEINKINKEETEKKALYRLETNTVKEILKSGKCICGEPLVEGDFHYENLLKLLQIVPKKSLGAKLDEIKNQSENIKHNAKNYYKKYSNMLEDFEELENQISVAADEESSLYNQLTDTTEGEKARIEYEKIKRDIISLQSTITSKKAAIITINKDIARLNEERKKLININSTNAKYIKASNYAKALYESLNKEYTQKEEITKNNLEEKINEIFPKIYDGGMKIEVNNRYDIKVVVDEDDLVDGVVEKNTAQRYSIIFAFITSIISMAKEKAQEEAETMLLLENDTKQAEILRNEGFPLVMDAPLSNFDKTRIKQICSMLPEVAKQVIFFIKDTDGDVAESHLEDRILKRYEIAKVNDSSVESVIKEIN